MKQQFILSIIFSLIFVGSGKSVPIDEKETEFTQEFCGNFAECRSVARRQFENCVGGFTEMFLTQSLSFGEFKGKSSEMSVKCEKELVEAVETEIRPFYEKIERETFDCAAVANPNAFNLDQTQRINCKLIQSEVKAESFAISETKNNKECKEIYDSQLKRCDLIKECCPQFNHCRMKAEIQNKAFGKEEKLAKQFEHCLGKQNVDFHSPPSSSEPPVTKPAVPEAETEEFPDEPKTTIEKRKAPEAPAETEAPTPATLPPPDKVFNDLVALLFPALTTTTPPPPPTTQPPTTETTEAPTTTTSTTTQSPESLEAEKQAAEAKKEYLKNFQFSHFAAIQKKAELYDALDAKSKAALSEPKTKKIAPVVPAEKNDTKPVVSAQSDSPTVEASIDSVAVEVSKPIVEESTTSAPTTTSASTTTTPKPVPTTPSPELPKLGMKSEHEKIMVSKMFCEEYMECKDLVEKQFKICDDKYVPTALLYGIPDKSLRDQFTNNSVVDDDKVKRRCLEAVDPETLHSFTNWCNTIIKTISYKSIRQKTRPN
uniref:Uncharacterized protein n=1 Tax=Panagrolaimus sp. JU765 TaxID=591449 RepID=A0AC34QF59_9BILA